MEPALLASLALVAGFFALLLDRSLMPAGLIAGGGRLPRRIAPTWLQIHRLPESAESAVVSLSARLARAGFTRVDEPSQVHELEGRLRRVFVVPFVHRDENALFLLVMECSNWSGNADLMLHIITPLSGERRVETTTLAALNLLRPPAQIGLRVVTDAESVDEIWSHHRRALTEHRREERLTVDPGAWKTLASSVYESWLEVAARAHRLRLSSDGQSFRIRTTVD